MATTLPTIVFVHGAWHRPVHYEAVFEGLRSKGYTVIAVENETAGSASDIAGKTHEDDARVIGAAMTPYLDAGHKILVVCHSYGGIPATACIEGKTWADRAAAGVPGGVIGIVYITAFALPAHISLRDVIGGSYGDWHDTSSNKVIELTGPYKTALYNDVPPERVETASQQTVSQSLTSFETASRFIPSDLSIPKVYVACELDQAIPIAGQLAMAGAAGASLIEFRCGHSPFLKDAETRELVTIISEFRE